MLIMIQFLFFLKTQMIVHYHTVVLTAFAKYTHVWEVDMAAGAQMSEAHVSHVCWSIQKKIIPNFSHNFEGKT